MIFSKRTSTNITMLMSLRMLLLRFIIRLMASKVLMNKLLLGYVPSLRGSAYQLSWIVYLIVKLIVFMSLKPWRRVPTSSFSFIITTRSRTTSTSVTPLLLLHHKLLVLRIIQICRIDEQLLFLLHVRRWIKNYLF